MNTPEQKSDYMLLFRGTDWDKELSPEQAQKIGAEWLAWFQGLCQQGKAIGGHPLVKEGRTVSGKKGRTTVSDGPFPESKEAIGGYFYLQVADMAEAVAIAQQCPSLELGTTVEVRPVADQCPVMKRAMEQLASAAA